MEHLHNLKIDDSIKAKSGFYQVASRGKNDIKFIVIHYFGSLGTARAVANWFHSSDRVASAHYVVDEGDTVYQSVADKDIAYAVGARTYKHKIARNSNTISIEVRPSITDKSRATEDDFNGWYFEEDVIKNVITLTVALMIKYDVSIDNVIRHYDVTGKYCPRPLMGDDYNVYYKTTGNKMWEDFKRRVLKAYKKEKGETMPLEPWKQQAFDELHQAGILSDKEGWIEKEDEPMPVWAVVALLNSLYKKLNK